MAEKYLVDTNAIIKYLAVTLPSKSILFMDRVVDSECNISFITVIELQVWNPENPADTLVYRKFIAGSNTISISQAIIKQTIAIRKRYKLQIPDAIIAATAIANRLTLVSDNDRDFKKVNGLKYINPSSIK